MKDLSTPSRKSKGPARGNGKNLNDAPDVAPGSFQGSHSISDNVASSHKDDESDSIASMEEANDNERGPMGAQILAKYISECIHNSNNSNVNMDKQIAMVSHAVKGECVAGVLGTEEFSWGRCQ
mmetsp:Transcript_81/g.159  ORF Transcript_81/g.159 Transcript_81/m.159 type:complete len:124 (+) Transcript_81:434-805(+)